MQFVDQLPRVIATKADPMRRQDDPKQQAIVARALEATVHQRQATLTYYSKSSDRTKTYLIHPYRLAYAQAGLYLLAYVPEYGQVRTFAIERIEDLSLLEQRQHRIVTLKAERDELKNSVALLDPDHVDPDLSTELVRENLNVAHEDEYILELPQR